MLLIDEQRPPKIGEDRFLLGPTWVWGTALAVAVAIAFLVAIAGQVSGILEYGYLQGAFAVLGIVSLILLITGPSKMTVGLFVAFFVLHHQYRSPFILPWAGVEWHPREIMLLILLAHFGFKFMIGQTVLRPDMIHYFFYVYMTFFAFIAARGALRQPDLQLVIAECRYPLMLAAYFPLVACVRDKADLRYFLRLVLALSLAIALAAIAFFLYTLGAGNIINVQNWLGEYVPRQIGPFRLQSIRPNGHLFFEVATVVLFSLMLCRETPLWRKILYASFILLFSIAMLLTMMRTAYITTTVSLLALGLLFLPRELQALAWFFGLVLLGAIFIAVGFQAHEALLQLTPGDIGASLMGRFVEIEGAWQAFLRDPLLGAGMGSSFEGMGYVARNTLVSITQAEYQSVHNAWVYFLFKGGIVGLTLVLFGLGGIIWRGYWVIDRMTNMSDRFLMRGLLAAFIGQLIASLAMPRLTYPIGGILVAMVTVAFAVMARDVESVPQPNPPRTERAST